MHRNLAIPAALILLGNPSRAEHEIRIEVEPFPIVHGYPAVTGEIGWANPETYSAIVTGPEGDPPAYTAHWTNDGQFLMPTPIQGYTLSFACGDQQLNFVIPTYMADFYIPGQIPGPGEIRGFGLDLTGTWCPGSWVDDLRILREGNSIRLEWSTVPNALHYRVYILDDPAGDFTQATLLAEVGQLEYEFNMPAAPAAQTFFVTAVFEP